MADSDSSGLSSADEQQIKKLAPIFQKAKKATKLVAPPPKASPPRPKRPPSPPHEITLADNDNVATIVMFRSRFASAFSTKLAHLGPQDVENGVQGPVPSKEVEGLLCALLGLVLNRKKPVEHGHYGRALEEAIQTQKAQWPYRWQGVNPLSGGRDFNSMSADDRLYLLRTLIYWSLSSSEIITGMIKDSYKQVRHNDDENQPLSVQHWGLDGDKRRYFLIEGQDDTPFRVYRQAHWYGKNAQWYNMAGSIEEIRVLAEKLDKEDGSQRARTFGQRMLNAIPRFEATEEKRRRREYRQARRAAFDRPEPGFSLYEGRTRGKRARYNFDDDDVFESDATSTRRSARQSERNTPAEVGPTYTASGRQVRARQGGEYGASLLSGQRTSPDELAMGDGTGDDSEAPTRGRRSGRTNGESGLGKRKRVIEDDEDEVDFSEGEDAPLSGDEWNSDANGEDDDMPDADDEDEDLDEEDLEDGEPRSLIVKLKTGSKSQANGGAGFSELPAHNRDDLEGDPVVPNLSTADSEVQLHTTKSELGLTASMNGTASVKTPNMHAQDGTNSGYPTPTSLEPTVLAQKTTAGLVPQQPASAQEVVGAAQPDGLG